MRRKRFIPLLMLLCMLMASDSAEGPAPDAFAGFPLAVAVAPRCRTGDGEPTPCTLVASLLDADAAAWGLRLSLTTGDIPEDCTPRLSILLTDPCGASLTDYDAPLPFAAGPGRTIGWAFYDLTWYFQQVRALYHRIPAGTYTVSVLLDGAPADTADFTVHDAPQPPLTLSSVTAADGTVTVSWPDNGLGPWRLRCFAAPTGDAAADFAAPDAIPLWDETTSDNQLSTQALAPGHTWRLLLEDSAGGTAVHTFSLDAGDFTAFDASVYADCLLLEGDSLQPANGFRLRDIQADGVSCGLRTGVIFSNAEEERPCLYQMVLEAPGGLPLVLSVQQVVFPAGAGRSLGWDFFPLDSCFLWLEQALGAVPEGEYRLLVYLDGMLAGASAFQVAEEWPETPPPNPTPTESTAPLSITGALRNSDGTVTLAWQDPAQNGPYTVRWCEASSDDWQADWLSAWAHWTAAEGLSGTSHPLQYLAPGIPYWLVVEDAAGHQDALRYTLPREDFTAFGTRIVIALRERDNVTMRTVTRKTFSASRTARSTIDVGLKIDLEYAKLAHTRDYLAMFVLQSPTGHTLVDWVSPITLEAEERTVSWPFFGLDDSLDLLSERLGGLPTGTYTLLLYYDGLYVARTAFEVTP